MRALADLGLRALSGVSLSMLAEEAVEVVAEGLSAEYCGFFEPTDGQRRLRLRSSAGLDEGVVERAVVDAGVDSFGGYALASGRTVVAEDFLKEGRFSVPPLLRGARSGVGAALRAGGGAFGVLVACAKARRSFDREEIGFFEGVVSVLEAAKERELAEERAAAAERRFGILSEAHELLAASLDSASTLAGTAHIAVPALADLAFVDLVEAGDLINRLVVVHANYVAEDLARELRYHYPLGSHVNHGTPKVLRTGRPELIPEVRDEMLVDVARDEKHLRILRRLNPRSYMCVPLQVRRRLIGAVGLISATSNRRYGEEDLALAESLTLCAALAIDRSLHHLPEMEAARELVRLARQSEPVLSANPEDAPALTRRQAQVLGMLSRGSPARKIGEELGLSEATIRGHIRALLNAFDAHSQIEVLARARQAGLLDG